MPTRRMLALYTFVISTNQTIIPNVDFRQETCAISPERSVTVGDCDCDCCRVITTDKANFI